MRFLCSFNGFRSKGVFMWWFTQTQIFFEEYWNRQSRRTHSISPMFLFVAFLLIFPGHSFVCAQVNYSLSDVPLSSACEYDYPPFCIVEEDSTVTGFSVELLRAAMKAMGREVSFQTGTWEHVGGLLARGEIDALPLVGRTPERESLFDFSVPYMSLYGAIVVRQDATGIQDLADLKGLKVAVMTGDNAEEFLRRVDRDFEIYTTPTFKDAFRDLSDGRCDAVVTQRIMALRLIQDTGLTNLRVINRPLEGYRQDFCFAVTEADRETLTLLNEGLALVMADGTYRYLYSKWFASMELPTNRRIVFGGDYNFPPYEFLDENGRPAGYTVDLTRAIAQEMGIDIEIRLGPWTEIMESLERGEIDAIQGMFYSPERDLKFDFSQVHLVNHYVTVVRNGEGPPPVSIEELRNKRIVVQKGDFIHEYLVDNGLSSQITTVETHEDVLMELHEGNFDCGAIVRMSTMYYIEKHGYSELVMGKQPLYTAEYCYAVHPHQRALLAQLSEGLKILEESGEYRRIFEKWMGIYEERPTTLHTVLHYLSMVIIPLLLVIAGSLLWSWSLRKQVARSTAEFRASEKRYRRLFESAKDGILILDADTGVIEDVNPFLIALLGFSYEDIVGKSLWELGCFKDIMPNKEKFLELQRKEYVRYENLPLETVDGRNIAVEFVSNVYQVNNLKVIQCNIRDITARKQAEDEKAQLFKWRQGINRLQQSLLEPVPFENKLKYVTDSIVRVFDVDFCRIWLIRPGDLCERDCVHARVHEGPHVCRYRDKCLHLLASSGRYTHTDGEAHRRVPFGCYKIGRVASDEDPKFVINDVLNDPRVHDHDWARELGLVSFAGYQLHTPDGKPLGVMALFSRSPIIPAEDEMLEGLSTAVAMTITQSIAEDALKQSESRYRMLFENAAEGILIADLHTMVFYYANPAISAMLGYSTEELLKMRVGDIHPKEYIDQIKSDFNAMARGEKTLAQASCLRKDGEIIYVNVSTTKTLIDGRECNVGFFTDVTEQKRAEEERRISEEKIQLIFNASPDPITVFDLNGIISECNPATLRMYGLSSKEEVLGRSIFDFVAPVDREKAEAILVERLQTGFNGGMEFLFVTNDGREFPGEVSAGVIHDPSGNPRAVVLLTKDVSERKLAEKNLIESEVRWRSYVENAPDGIFITDENGRYLQVNPEACRVTGYNESELLSMGIADLLTPESREAGMAGFAEMATTGKVHGEYTYLTKAGEQRWWSVDAVALSGNRFLGFTKDITERKAAEEIIQNAYDNQKIIASILRISLKDISLDAILEQSLKVILSLNIFKFESKGAIFLVDKDNSTIILKVHSGLSEKILESCAVVPFGNCLCGRAADTGEIVFADSLDDRHETQYAGIQDHGHYCVPIISSAKTTLGVMTIYVKAGHLRDPKEDEFLIAVANTLSGIIQRKQSEDERILLTTAIEQASEIVMITDVNGMIQYVNPAFEKITGYTSEESLGRNPRMLASGKQDAAFYENMWSTILSGAKWSGRITNKKKDGSLYTENASITPVKNIAGVITNFAAVKSDVTNELLIDLRIRETQKMEAIGMLAGGIAHDFNNILAAILGYTELSLETVSEESQLHSDLTQIFKAGNRARDLINQILTFSRQSELEKAPILIAPIVKESLKLLRASLPSSIEIRQNILIETGVVLADPTQIHQVVMNLCTNAGHEMREKGGILEVTLDSKKLDAGFCLVHPGLIPGAYVLLMISDTGLGIPREILPRIFEPYFTTKDKSGGTGLGLSVVHGIVTECGGLVTVYSEVGKGATFKVYLPLIAEKPSFESENKPSIAIGHERILFVDDEESILHVGKRILEQIGYTVTAVGGSMEALELFEKNPGSFDLVITDMTMPFMTGDELAAGLMRVRQDIPIIILTGYSEKLTKENALSLGIRAYMGKPLLKSEMAETVRRVLDQQHEEI